jgi:hypothetical protein
MTVSSLELWRLKIRQQNEDMFVRMLGKRDVITTQPDDPAHITAILEEWSVMISIIRQGYKHLWAETR